jgi:predicted naringenin-chalcone synthase
MKFQIAGIGAAVPQQFVTQADAARIVVEYLGAVAGQATTIPAIYRRAGVHRRHSVLLESSTNGEPARQSFYPIAADADFRGPSTAVRMRRYEAHALDLAARAVQAALDDAAVAAGEIGHLVTVSCSGFSSPGVDIGLIERLGLPRHATRTHIGFMGCHGALNALRVAGALASADPGSRVLICCVELCTIHQQYSSDTEQIVASALFSDGAAALVGTVREGEATDTPEGEAPAEPPRSTAAREAAIDNAWRVLDQRSLVLPETTEMMSWRIGDHGFHMTLSPEVPAVIHQRLRPWISAWLAEHALTVQEVRGWAIHPGGPKILTACAAALELGDACLAASQQVLAEFGNMSSPTILFILERLRRQCASRPCVALAFGPGLTIEAALLG